MIVYSFKNPNRNGIKERTSNKSKQQEKISKNEENNMFNEMILNLEKYKGEVTQLVLHGKRIEDENFKKTFFGSLESLLNQVGFMRDKKLKEQKIENIYKWYKTKLKYFYDLNDITKKTKKFYYENYPNLEDFKKSDYYEAGNFPIYFERDNRTEEKGIMPPKDRLKNYIRKKIIKNDKNLEESTKMGDERERLLSATDSAMRSTNATNFYSTNMKIFNSNAENSIDPRIEIKSSYSTYRPQYNSNNLAIEKMTEVTKNRELAEKRNKEEMKEFLNEFGINRARFKSEVEKKIETKNLIKFYEQNLNQDDVDDLKSEINDKEERYSKKSQTDDNQIENPDTNANIYNNIDSNNHNTITNTNSNPTTNTKRKSITQNRNSIIIPKLNLNSNTTLTNKETISIDQNKRKSISNKNSSETIHNIANIQAISQISVKSSLPIKVNTNNIKNLNDENKIKTNSEEVIVNIRMKSSNINNRETLLTETKLKEQIPSDLIAVNNDKINDLRNKYSKMLSVKEVDTTKDNYKDYFSPLSAFDSMNSDVHSISPYEKKLNKSRPLTSYEYVRNNFDCNNLLEQRKTLSSLKFRDMYRLTETLQKNKKYSKLFSQIQEAFLPYEEVIYPKYYLPLPDYGMLSRPLDITEKKKKGDIKKKN